MKQQKTHKPVSIGTLVKDFLKEHKQKETTFQQKILKDWDKIVTKKASRHARPLSIKNNTLIVVVNNSAWLHQLTLKKVQILKKINRLSKNNQLTAIRLKIGE